MIFNRLGLATRALAVLAFVAFGTSSTRAVILLGTGDPEANTTEPTGALAGSGWQYQGAFGVFLGTAIAPRHFLTAKHVWGDSFVYNGTTHTLQQRFADPYSDLSIWQVPGTLPTFAPLYSGLDETGRPLVVFGRGHQRGGAVFINGELRGWAWGGGDARQRWGENVVTTIVNGGPQNQYIYATFDSTGSPNEAHLAAGDSGGAVFINEGGVWKVAGISYAVDGPFFNDVAGSGGFNGAVFDARGFYYQVSNNPPAYSLITGPAPVPSGFYASRVSSKRAWIYSVIDPAGDIDGNGVSNLLDYARSLNEPSPAGPGAPIVAKEGAFLAITYRQLNRAGALTYAIEKSTNLKNWEAVPQTPTFLGSAEDVDTLKVQVPMTGNRMFLRVRIGLATAARAAAR